ncbi:hypothetical protein H6P81_006376 [Aristolochia fimbriata]|uniref:Uncharacterized protein n=1 Tax=Aristolochia fimbriata TaxID=158543 RepID=A0AAV7EXA5_ARIFI|nr:hypothetical protein H6P81_006376 [Aristolochia fimbriata]
MDLLRDISDDDYDSDWEHPRRRRKPPAANGTGKCKSMAKATIVSQPSSVEKSSDQPAILSLPAPKSSSAKKRKVTSAKGAPDATPSVSLEPAKRKLASRPPAHQKKYFSRAISPSHEEPLNPSKARAPLQGIAFRNFLKARYIKAKNTMQKLEV